MRNLLKFYVALATFVLLGGSALAQTASIDGVIYTVYGDSVHVTGNDGSVTEVNIPATVTINSVEYPVRVIGDDAFYHRSNITSVTLPEGIVSIGTRAFYNTSSLTDMNLPSTLKAIGSQAFRDSGVKFSELPAGLKELGDYAFYGSNVTLTEVPESITDLKSRVFCNCDNITSFTFHDGITSISESAFSDCNNLSDIVFSNSLLSIGSYAFYGCTGLTSITLPESIESVSAQAFYNCSNLTSVEASDTPIKFGENAFYGCPIPAEGEVKYIGANAVEVENKRLTEYIVKEGTKTISDRCFYNCTNMTSIDLPAEMVYVGSEAFYGCNNLPIVNFVRYADSYAIKATNNTLMEYTIKEGTTMLGDDLFYGCSSMQKINIPDGVISIGRSAFYNCHQLEEFQVPSSVSNIGDYAFYRCSKLASAIEIPSAVEELGAYVFNECQALPSVTLNEGLKSIGQYAFRGCTNLASLSIPSTVTSIGNYAFNGCASLASSIEIPSGVETIGSYAFDGCSSLMSLTLNEGLETIGEYAFRSCSKISSLSIPSTVTSIGQCAFYGCSSIASEITIPSGVNEISNNAFYGCTSIPSVVINEGVGSIGSEVFRNCYKISSVLIPSTVSSIGDRAFNNCSLLKDVVLPEGVTRLNSEVFRYCSSLFSLELPSTIEAIYSSSIPETLSKLVCKAKTPPSGSPNQNTIVFVPEGCGEAYDTIWTNNVIVEGKGVSVDVNITTPGTFGLEVLKQADYLKDVNYLKVGGSLNSDDLVLLRGSLPNLVEIDYSDLKVEDFTSSYAPSNNKFISIVLPKSLKKISSGVSSPNLRSVVVPEGVTSIGSDVFRYCSMLKDVTLPSTLKSIGNYCFYQTKIENIILPEGLTSLGQDSFRKTRISEIVIPDSIEILTSCVFYECSRLTNVVLPKNLREIGHSAFNSCSNLKAIDLPETLENIGSSAFSSSGLENVVLPEGLHTIGTSAFYNCDNLKTLFLPSTLYKCGDEIVNECNNLQSVTCLSIVPPTVTSGLLGTGNTWTLYVPSFSLEAYKMSVGWNNFYKIEPLNGVVSETISIYDEQMLDLSTENLIASGAPLDYKPDVYIRWMYDNGNYSYSAGKLKTVGTVTSAQASMSIGKFEMDQTRSTSTMTSFINMLESDSEMTADSVVTNLEVSKGGWHFLSFPYDVKISDISTMGDWVIRRYDGAARANGDYSNTWVTVPYEETLNAGEGYIWTTTNGNFRIPAVDNENKNNLFANSTQYVPLREFASTTIADNSWNLVGNPFPCYYDTRFLEYTAPITVRNGNSYSAYSPVDDSYILMPLEAFFVQKPSNVESIGFTTDGRQTNNVARTLDAEAKTRTLKAAERKVFNISIEGMGSADRTRFVINESASSAYEMECDAAKFMSDDTSVPQIFTVENADRLAINERPMGNGEIALGAYFGTAGTYTLSLDTKCTHTVVLVDNITGEEAVLTDGDYTFEAEQGMFNDRFTIRLWNDIVNGVDETVSGNKVTVSAASDGIVVMNATEDVYVYNTAGSLMDVKSGDSVFFSLPKGMYVVKVGNESYKISVTR